MSLRTYALLFAVLFLRPLLHADGFPLLVTDPNRSSTETSVAHTIRSTWQNPSDTLSILLIIGGDVVLKALAQLSGRRLAPVAFSFGWVAYSFNTLMSVFGDGRLMPPPDNPAKLINLQSGSIRESRSWVLGRLLRDFERPLSDKVAASITVFEALPNASYPAGVPSIDWCWIGGVVTILLQLGISAIPFGLQGDWSTLLVTVSGTVLALATSALPQWRSEKWACRRNTNKIFSLTGGNGSRDIIVIIGAGQCLDLEDLAVAESPMVSRGNTKTFRNLPRAFVFTQVACLLLAVLWIVFLITVTSIKSSAWYLLLVGGLGMVQNAIAAGARRGMGTSGIHLEMVEEIAGAKVMHAVMDFEDAYAGIGRPLMHEFFSDESNLRPTEVKWWNGDRREYDDERFRKYPDSRPKELSDKAYRARERYRERRERSKGGK